MAASATLDASPRRVRNVNSVRDDASPWERQPKETDIWFDRFQRFLYLGVTRSIYQAYITERMDKATRKKQKEAGKEEISARSGLPKSWRDAAKRWNWKYRATAFDDAERKKRDELYRARADEILASGFAARFARIAELNRLAELLQDEIWTDDKRWLPDVKQIGSGEDAERVDIVRFNSSVIEQYRQTLDDIAKELGERKQNVKLDADVTHYELTSDKLAAARKRAEEYEKKFENVV